ncbi:MULTISPECIES: MFS transporter [unclassified Devosia]|uniref:MFS transporter n=1 Tax=unclassified Devosia TaxID=196773 RepID=UPI00145EF2CC|nr:MULTISPECIES: MFS transporter [unclassified Devosia]MBJ6987217.1 MFS transporter [Devosia sp. MC521]MBK1795234.1 MFS transporter [Devosia sp. WQ 349K1]QMW64410.1 MFS transporter [Devosia sp. MC521]
MRFGLSLPPQISVFGAFFVYSFCMGSMFPRLPDIRSAMNVAEGMLGLALIGSAVGTLISLTFAGPVIEKYGHKRVLLIAIPLLSVLYAASMWAQTPLAFFLLLVPVGLTIGAIEIIINIEADRVEHLIGRRIMNRAHGFWSLGFFAAGIVGATVAQTGLSPQLHLMLMVPVVLVATLLLLGQFKAAPHRQTSAESGPKFARPTMTIMALVGVCLSAMLMEGAGIDWSAIYMKDLFGVEPFWAGIAVAFVAGSQAATRFVADSFVERYSPVRVARVLLTILLIGTLIVFWAPSAIASYLGFALIGVGSSALFPLAMSAAAQQTDRPAAINVAALAQFSFTAFLLGPPLLGFIAEHWGIQWTFGVGLPLILISLLTSHVLAPKPVSTTVPR